MTHYLIHYFVTITFFFTLASTLAMTPYEEQTNLIQDMKTFSFMVDCNGFGKTVSFLQNIREIIHKCEQMPLKYTDACTNVKNFLHNQKTINNMR